MLDCSNLQKRHRKSKMIKKTKTKQGRTTPLCAPENQEAIGAPATASPLLPENKNATAAFV